MPRRSAPLALGLIFAALIAHALSYGLNVQDDAFISYRYAQNLVDGHGLVFNPGERVEGITNLLWTIGLAGVIRLGGDPLLASVLAGVLGALGLAGVSWALMYAEQELVLTTSGNDDPAGDIRFSLAATDRQHAMARDRA